MAVQKSLLEIPGMRHIDVTANVHRRSKWDVVFSNINLKINAFTLLSWLLAALLFFAFVIPMIKTLIETLMSK
ncbi:hypothetical protein FC15_GL000665 [Lapidilactobacillus concavus DSM 17758]|uniref:Uncharacterized protein n=1 Tax=Lapidilactobacillus concavus DSM 17758 TaxID=1423735 RepID=A0A0R1VRZ1_9LACO|nr:hypothetical protein [Lapidilactobacillus concavus]KRM08370.1 hypothetical protein FC15_GL000665 [Lapidilactobacillus concavus DSM 17758]GEL13861.1 hypothetical protein LCO01nite_14100 [Lapidilactobacillus concavus]